MKHLILVFLSLNLLLVSCDTNKKDSLKNTAIKMSIQVPDTMVDISVLDFDRKTSIWRCNDEAYSGYASSFHKDGVTLKEKFGIKDGRKQNQDSTWYDNGTIKQVANYHTGKLHGEKKYWLLGTSHVLVSQLSYQNGQPHGEQKTWYPTGELHKKLNLIEGKEIGIQQAYRKNGVLYANYEAKNGRIFGLKKASLCFGLEDQNMTYGK